MARRNKARRRKASTGRRMMNEMSAPKNPPSNSAIVAASHKGEAVRLWFDSIDTYAIA